MRRAFPLVLAVVLGAGAAEPVPEAEAEPVPEAGPVWHPYVRAAKQYARTRGGDVSFAVRTPGRLGGWRPNQTMTSASVVKAMLMIAYLNREGVRGRRLNDGDRALLGPMVRRSDNAAANRVYGIVGAEGLYRLARRVGMRHFSTMPVWGGSQITASDQTRLFLRIERYVVRRHRDTALRLLGSVVSYQRWGIARVKPPGWMLYFKGGWTSVVQNQVGLYRRGADRIAIAVLTSDSPSVEYGRETEYGIARRLLRGLGPGSNLGR